MTKKKVVKRKIQPKIKIEAQEDFGRVSEAGQSSIVEKVMSERNLMTGTQLPPWVNPMDVLTGKDTGVKPVTKTQQEFLNWFNDIFSQVTAETMTLSVRETSPEAEQFIRGYGITQDQVDLMRKAKPWTVFQIPGKEEGLMKTPDNKLESVRNYCYRLERAVLDQIQRNKNDRLSQEDTMKYLHAELNERQIQLASYQAKAVELNMALQSGALVLRSRNLFGSLKSLILKLFGELKSFTLKHFGEEHKNG